MRTKLLKVILIVTGVMFCLTAPMIFVPASWWPDIVRWFVGAEAAGKLWPTGPLFAYALRASLVAYLWIGVTLLVAAADPHKHRAHIDVAIGALFLFGIVCLIAGLRSGLPTWWFLGDALPSLAAAFLLALLRPRRTP